MLLVLVALGGLLACGSSASDQPAAVDLSGIWIGSYDGGGGIAGTISLDLSQDGSALVGVLGVVGTGVDSGNGSLAVRGTVSGRRLQVHPHSTSDRVEGTEAGGTLSGTISSASLTVNWTASRVPTQTLRTTATQPVGPAIRELLAAQDGALWFSSNSLTAGVVERVSTSGAVLTSIDAHCVEGLDRCLDGFICSDGGLLLRITPQNQTWVVAPLGSAQGSRSTCDSTSVWAVTYASFSSGFQTVKQLDLSGNATGVTIAVPGLIDGLTFDGTDLLVLTSQKVLRFSIPGGTLIGAYQLPEMGFYGSFSNGLGDYAVARGLTWDGAWLWTLRRTGPGVTVAARLAPGEL